MFFFLSSFILAATNLHVIQKKNCSHADSRKPQCDLKQCNEKKTIIPNPPSLSYKFASKSLQWLKANRIFVIRTAQSHPPQHTQKHRNVITRPINKASFPQINKNTRSHSPSNNAIFTKCKVCGLFSRNTHLGHNSLASAIRSPAVGTIIHEGGWKRRKQESLFIFPASSSVCYMCVSGQRWNAPTLADTRGLEKAHGWAAEHTLGGSIDSLAA